MTRLLATLSDLPADIVIALSGTDLISFGVRWREGSQGVVGMRRSDIPPLVFPIDGRGRPKAAGPMAVTTAHPHPLHHLEQTALLCRIVAGWVALRIIPSTS
jgi:hypothetical protein